MWLMTQYGFFSVVQSPEEPWMLQIRARDKRDLKNLMDFAAEIEPDAQLVMSPILCTPAADYPFRLIVCPDDFANLMAHMVNDIDYTNFKSRVTQRQGSKRHDIYMRIWGILHDVADRPRSRAKKPANGQLPLTYSQRLPKTLKRDKKTGQWTS